MEKYKYIIIIFLVLIFAAIGWQVYRLVFSERPVSIYEWRNWLNFGQHKACTQEAKLCPDGSYVGRTGPNCEFAACPAINNELSCVTDSDCSCGTKIGTGECFAGNKDYVNKFGQCPDFCTGIDGKLTIKCSANRCIQTR